MPFFFSFLCVPPFVPYAVLDVDIYLEPKQQYCNFLCKGSLFIYFCEMLLYLNWTKMFLLYAISFPSHFSPLLFPYIFLFHLVHFYLFFLYFIFRRLVFHCVLFVFAFKMDFNKKRKNYKFIAFWTTVSSAHWALTLSDIPRQTNGRRRKKNAISNLF